MGPSERNLAWPYGYFNSINDYQKPVSNNKNEYFFSKLENDHPIGNEIDWTKDGNKVFLNRNGEELTKLYIKSDVILLADSFEKIIKVSITEFDINPLYCVGVPGYTWLWGLKYIDIKIQTIQDKELNFTFENIKRRRISTVLSSRWVKTDDKKKILYIVANNLYGCVLSQNLLRGEIKFEKKNVKLEDILNTPDDTDVGCLVEVGFSDPDKMKEKAKRFPFALENGKLDSINFIPYIWMKTNQIFILRNRS